MKPNGKGWIAVSKKLPNEGKKVEIWVDIYASPRSMGWADSSPEPDCWLRKGKWVHMHKGEVKEIYHDYVTHWRAQT